MGDLLSIYRLVLILCAIGVAVSTLEFWAIAASFSPSGVYSWRILQWRFGIPGRIRTSPLVATAFDERGIRVLLLVRLAALAWVVVVPLGSLWFTAGMALLVASNLIFTWRRLYGDDGSDQMNTIILVTLLLTVGPHANGFLLKLGLWFIALQACLSYTTAGIAKLVSPIWRNGEAIFRIFNTGTYGLSPVARLLERRRWLNRLLCWTVIGMETLFPLCLILPSPWNWVFLGWGFLFHLQCAIVMGLNSFLWAFVATYPAILLASTTVRAFLAAHHLA